MAYPEIDRPQSRNFLYEIMMILPVAALCAAMAVSSLYQTAGAARRAHALDTGMNHVQTAADLMSAHAGDMLALSDMFPYGRLEADGSFSVYFDDEMEALRGMDGAAFSISVQPAVINGLLGTSDVSLHAKDGDIIWMITASWQAD